MKINIVKGKNLKLNQLVEDIAKKLYPSAVVESKQAFKPSELEGSVVIEDVTKLTNKSAREIAMYLISLTGMGVSNKVLETL